MLTTWYVACQYIFYDLCMTYTLGNLDDRYMHDTSCSLVATQWIELYSEVCQLLSRCISIDPGEMLQDCSVSDTLSCLSRMQSSRALLETSVLQFLWIDSSLTASLGNCAPHRHFCQSAHWQCPSAHENPLWSSSIIV